MNPPEQEARFGEAGIFLERVLELDARSLGVVLFQEPPRRLHHLLGARSASAQQHCDDSGAGKRLHHSAQAFLMISGHVQLSFLSPNRFIKSYSVGRLMPSTSAAFATFPFTLASTRITARRSASSRT